MGWLLLFKTLLRGTRLLLNGSSCIDVLPGLTGSAFFPLLVLFGSVESEINLLFSLCVELFIRGVAISSALSDTVLSLLGFASSFEASSATEKDLSRTKEMAASSSSSLVAISLLMALSSAFPTSPISMSCRRKACK